MGRFCARDFKPRGRLLPWVVWGLLGCGGDDNTGPGEGALEIIASTTGAALDPDGYFLMVDNGAPRSLEPTSAITVAALSPGPHTVQLAGITASCVLDGENPRTVEIAAGETASVRFDITCNPALQLRVSTTGSELDPDGYGGSIDGEAWGPLAPNDVEIVPFLQPGPHTIALSGVAPNCAVSGENPRTVNFVDGEGANVHFDVVCNPAGTLEVVIAPNAGDPDPDGYVVTLNGGPRMGISAQGGRFEFLSPGDYTVALSDVAPNCILSGPNIATATLVSGGVATVNFTVVCGPLVAVPPGQDIAVDANTEIYLLSADGSKFVNLTNNSDDEFFVKWSPNGRKIVFTSGHDVIDGPFPYQHHFESHVFVMNADGSGRTQLTNGVREEGAAWSPDGGKIAYMGATPDSSSPDSSSHLFVMDADGSRQTQLTRLGRLSSYLNEGELAWSPNGTKIAYSNGVLDHPGILVINADGSEATRLTDGIDRGAAWSPDGTKIAFVRAVLGRGADIYVVNADGSGLAQLSSDTGGSRPSLSWSPDGTKIAFEQNGAIYLVNGNGTGLAQLTFGPLAGLPAWSPDGGKIAYYTYEVTEARLYLMNLDGSGEVPLTPPWELGRPSSPAAWRP